MAGKRFVPEVRIRSITVGGKPVPPGYVPADIYLQHLVDYLVENYSESERRVANEMP